MPTSKGCRSVASKLSVASRVTDVDVSVSVAIRKRIMTRGSAPYFRSYSTETLNLFGTPSNDGFIPSE